MSTKKMGSAMLLTYVGSADLRTFSKEDSLGVELSFARNTPTEVDAKVAKAILADDNLSLEFKEGGEASTIDQSIDDAQEPIPGLEGDV